MLGKSDDYVIEVSSTFGRSAGIVMNKENIPSQPLKKPSLLTRSFHIRIPNWISVIAYVLLGVAIIVLKVRQNAELKGMWTSPDRPSIATFEVTKRFLELQEELPSNVDLLATFEIPVQKDSPYRAANLNFLANSYAAQGDYEKAEPLYEESLRLLKKYLGAKHPDVLTVEVNRQIAQSKRTAEPLNPDGGMKAAPDL